MDKKKIIKKACSGKGGPIMEFDVETKKARPVSEKEYASYAERKLDNKPRLAKEMPNIKPRRTVLENASSAVNSTLGEGARNLVKGGLEKTKNVVDSIAKSATKGMDKVIDTGKKVGKKAVEGVKQAGKDISDFSKTKTGNNLKKIAKGSLAVATIGSGAFPFLSQLKKKSDGKKKIVQEAVKKAVPVKSSK